MVEGKEITKNPVIRRGEFIYACHAANHQKQIIDSRFLFISNVFSEIKHLFGQNTYLTTSIQFKRDVAIQQNVRPCNFRAYFSGKLVLKKKYVWLFLVFYLYLIELILAHTLQECKL